MSLNSHWRLNFFQQLAEDNLIALNREPYKHVHLKLQPKANIDTNLTIRVHSVQFFAIIQGEGIPDPLTIDFTEIVAKRLLNWWNMTSPKHKAAEIHLEFKTGETTWRKIRWLKN